jgi:hypothetical protein
MSHVAEEQPEGACRVSPKCCRKVQVACRRSAAGWRMSHVAEVLLKGRTSHVAEMLPEMKLNV